MSGKVFMSQTHTSHIVVVHEAISENEPLVNAKEPCVSVKEPYIFTNKPLVTGLFWRTSYWAQ